MGLDRLESCENTKLSHSLYIRIAFDLTLFSVTFWFNLTQSFDHEWMLRLETRILRPVQEKTKYKTQSTFNVLKMFENGNVRVDQNIEMAVFIYQMTCWSFKWKTVNMLRSPWNSTRSFFKTALNSRLHFAPQIFHSEPTIHIGETYIGEQPRLVVYNVFNVEINLTTLGKKKRELFLALTLQVLG